MNAFDLIILAVLILLALRGVMKGVVSQIVSVGSYIVCWIVASRFAFLVAPSVPAEEPWNQVGAMIVLFVITMVAIRFAHSMIEKWVKSLRLDKLNRLLGGVLGFVKGLLVCMVLTFFGVMLSETTRTMIFESKSGLPLSELIAKTGTFIPQDSCELLRDQIARFNAKVSGEIPESDSVNSAESLLSEKSTGRTDLLSRGVALLGEVESLRNDLKSESQGAVSLLDGFRRWWNGTEPEPTEPNPVEEIVRRVEAEPVKAVTEMSIQKAFQIPAPPEPVEMQTTVAPSVAPISSLYQDEAMIRRSATAATETVVTSGPVASQAMAIPRSSAPFRFSQRSSDWRSSKQLLESTNATGASSPATLFSK